MEGQVKVKVESNFERKFQENFPDRIHARFEKT